MRMIKQPNFTKPKSVRKMLWFLDFNLKIRNAEGVKNNDNTFWMFPSLCACANDSEVFGTKEEAQAYAKARVNSQIDSCYKRIDSLTQTMVENEKL